MIKRVLSEFGIYLIAALLGCVIVETGYRAYLLYKDPRMQLRPEPNSALPPIGVYSRSMWRFDAAEGFQYVRDPIFITHVANGRIAGCQIAPPINTYGSPGLAEGSYEDAEVKIAVFGDSFSVFADPNNMTWVNYFQRLLQERLGRSVHVLNQARDGTGLLQMFDIAAHQVPKRKPDLAIIAFATNNMLAPRIWRIEKVIDGELRVITTFEPTETPDLRNSYETFILHPGAQGQWCEDHKNGGELDRIGSEIIDKYVRFRHPRHFALTPSRSFLWNRLVHADAFYSDAERSWGPLTSPEAMAKDARLSATIRALSDSGTPYILVHLPFYPEVKSGNEYSIPLAQQIEREISRLTGKPVHRLLDYIPLPVTNPERMNHSPDNLHPSTWGMQMYADAVGKIVLKNGFERHSAR
jgi:lysophospholipase L1-like esterase